MSIIPKTRFNFFLYQLTRPISYLRIENGSMLYYNWLFPVIFSLISVFFNYKFGSLDLTFFQNKSDSGLIYELTLFISNLPGFFIAALAAVATFNKNDIDDEMPNDLKLGILYNGVSIKIQMSRRRFLCVLFSYLTTMSIFLVILAKFMAIMTSASSITIYSFSFIYFTFFWQMITATLLGLYYLSERLHTPQ